MKSINQTYLDYINFPDENRTVDIYEHLPVLRSYAKKCNHITEMGVRWGASTVALLSTRPQEMISYDITKTGKMEEIKKMCENEKINHKFIIENVLSSSIEVTDLLFIDTLHSYPQLLCELLLHSSKAQKYIILHDTESFKNHDEGKPTRLSRKGLQKALEDFLDLGQWSIKEHFKNNNGLTILTPT